jgi:dienelactone hydrolase
MPLSVEWLGHRTVGTVVERSFRLPGATGSVPGVLWLPASCATPPPLVLLGHGGSGHKRSPQIVALARWFASSAGVASIAIDGPYHGDRVPAPMPTTEYQARIAATGIETVLDSMAADWHRTVDAVTETGMIDGDRLAYLGMSMGTRFGLPAVASLGTRVRCAVFGKFGLEPGPAMHPAMTAAGRVTGDARRITVPVLFHLPWHDDVFPRAGQLALFDLFGSEHKELVAYAGPHTRTTPAAITAWQDFTLRHLTG